MLKNLTIGRVAKDSGVGIETIRFYERKGLIRKPKKQTGSAFRTYDPADSTKIRFIKKTQALGFTLREIKDLLDLNANPRATCSDVKNRSDTKIKEIEAKIADLKQMKKSLQDISSACDESKGAVACCQIMECFEPRSNSKGCD